MISVFVANILILFAIPFMIWKKESNELSSFLWPGILLKYASGIAVGALYMLHYGEGDTIWYYRDGLRVAELAVTDYKSFFRFLVDDDHPIINELTLVVPRAMFFTKFAAVTLLVTGHNYWLTSCYFSLFSFVGAWFFVRQVRISHPAFTGASIFSCLFMPSVVFWSSGLIKESLAMGALFFLCGLFLMIRNKHRVSITWWLLSIPALWIVWGLKYYYIAVFIPVVITDLFMWRIIRERWPALKGIRYAAYWILVFALPVVGVTIVHPNFYPERFLEVIVSNHDQFVILSDTADIIHYNQLQPTALSLFVNAPLALVSGMFRPFVWEANNAAQWIASMENAFLAVMFAAAIVRIVKERQTSTLLGPTLLYCVLLCTFLAMSTPNFGTLSRYRVGFLPFFAMAIIAGNPLVNIFERFFNAKTRSLGGKAGQ